MTWILVAVLAVLAIVLGYIIVKQRRETPPPKFEGKVSTSGALTARKTTTRKVDKGKIQTNADRLDWICSKHSTKYEIHSSPDRKLVHLEFISGPRIGEILSGSGPTMDEAISDLAEKLGDTV